MLRPSPLISYRPLTDAFAANHSPHSSISSSSTSAFERKRSKKSFIGASINPYVRRNHRLPPSRVLQIPSVVWSISVYCIEPMSHAECFVMEFWVHSVNSQARVWYKVAYGYYIWCSH